MGLIVADTSALVSLGTVVHHVKSPVDILLDEHRVAIPTQVETELRETASYGDQSGNAAQAVLDRLPEFTVQRTELDADFPLDDGENAAVTLTNDIEATQFLCDEFNQLALIHASLADSRLVTTPTLLLAFVRNGHLDPFDADELFARLSDARSWENNSYVIRVRATLQQEMQ